MKIGCTIFWDDIKYEKIAKNAIDSFNHFHFGKVEMYAVSPEKFKNYNCSKTTYASGIKKYMVAYENMIKNECNKMIVLGADTITCDYLSEFIDNSEDILATLDYPYQFVTQWAKSPDVETHVNSDVVCFNNSKALRQIIENSIKHTVFFEQGGLNETLYSGKHNFSYKIVDYPYNTTNILYNARSKGNIIAETNTKPWKQYISKFYVKENKLFTHNAKQIKVWHYCDGFFTLTKEKVDEILFMWANEFFNNETKEFFKFIGCKEYF